MFKTVGEIVCFIKNLFTDCEYMKVINAKTYIKGESEIITRSVPYKTELTYICNSGYSPTDAQEVNCGNDGNIDISGVRCYPGTF